MKTTKNVKTLKPNAWKDTFTFYASLVLLSVAGLLLIVLPLMTLMSRIQARTLICIRLEPRQHQCRLETKLLGVVPLRTTPIIKLSKAGIAHEEVSYTSTTSNDQTITKYQTRYSVVLITASANIPLDAVGSTEYGPKQALAGRINAYLDDPQETSLRVRGYSLGWGGVVGFLIPMAMGLACLAPALVGIGLTAQTGFKRLAGSRFLQTFTNARKFGRQSRSSVKKGKREKQDKA